MEVIAEVEGMFDLVPDVGRAVISHKTIETVIDDVLPSLLFLLNFLLSSSLAPHHLRFHLHGLLILMPLLQLLLKGLNRYQLG